MVVIKSIITAEFPVGTTVKDGDIEGDVNCGRIGDIKCGRILKMWGFGYNSMEYKQGILGKFIPAHIGDTTKDGI
ncbi:1821_t:CDS:2 [Entrophospora sp. SA101]|nr:1821_t:CDS:2 [Entrophospora sp. SA101]